MLISEAIWDRPTKSNAYWWEGFEKSRVSGRGMAGSVLRISRDSKPGRPGTKICWALMAWLPSIIAFETPLEEIKESAKIQPREVRGVIASLDLFSP